MNSKIHPINSPERAVYQLADWCADPRGAAAGLTLAELGGAVSRPLVGLEEEPSHLERACEMARERVDMLSQAYSIASCGSDASTCSALTTTNSGLLVTCSSSLSRGTVGQAAAFTQLQHTMRNARAFCIQVDIMDLLYISHQTLQHGLPCCGVP